MLIGFYVGTASQPRAPAIPGRYRLARFLGRVPGLRWLENSAARWAENHVKTSLRLYQNEIKQRNKQFDRAEKLHGEIEDLERSIQADHNKFMRRKATLSADRMTEMAFELNNNVEQWKKKARALQGITSAWPQISDSLEHHNTQLSGLLSVAEISTDTSHSESVQKVYADLNELGEKISNSSNLVLHESPEDFVEAVEAKDQMMRNVQVELERKERAEAGRTETTTPSPAPVSQTAYQTQHPQGLLEAIGHYNTFSTGVIGAHSIVFAAAVNKKRNGRLSAAEIRRLQEIIDAARESHVTLGQLATAHGDPYAAGYHRLSRASLPQLRAVVKAANGMLTPRAKRLSLGRFPVDAAF